MLKPDPSPQGRLQLLWRGHYPLAAVFWLLGVVLRAVLWVTTYVVVFPFAYLFLSTWYGYYVLAAWVLLMVMAEFAINVVTWRTASRYPGRKAIAKVTKYLVVVVTLMAISNNYIYMTRLENLNLTRTDIGALNGALPVMIDDATRFDSVVARLGVIIFNYTIITPRYDPTELRQSTIAIRCKPENRNLLDAFRTSTSVYKNEAGQIIAAYTVSKNDCNES